MSKRVMVIGMDGKYKKSYKSVTECAKAEGQKYDVICRNIHEGTLNDNTLNFYDFETDWVNYGK